MRQIDFEPFADVKELDAILFIVPVGCKVARVFHVPECFKETGQYDDIVETLDTTCSKKLNQFWYFTPHDVDMLHYSLRHLFNQIDVPATLVERCGHGYDDNANPIPEILN